MSLTGDARAAGASAIHSVRVGIAERVASYLQRHPEFVADAVEVGLIDRNWLESPGQHPVSTATALSVVERFLERSVERQPSALAALGLNALQVLSWSSEGKQPETGGVATDVTIVFTDLEGFTRYTARNGDEAATALLAEHHKAVGPAVRSRGGRVVKRMGDGLMLSFPEPEAAVLAALELLGTAPEPLRLRAGIHRGEAVVTRDDIIGHVVNVAARVAETARGGQVLVTEEVRSACGPLRGVTFGRGRRRSFKGVDETMLVRPVTIS